MRVRAGGDGERQVRARPILDHQGQDQVRVVRLREEGLEHNHRRQGRHEDKVQGLLDGQTRFAAFDALHVKVFSFS